MLIFLSLLEFEFFSSILISFCKQQLLLAKTWYNGVPIKGPFKLPNTKVLWCIRGFKRSSISPMMPRNKIYSGRQYLARPPQTWKFVCSCQSTNLQVWRGQKILRFFKRRIFEENSIPKTNSFNFSPCCESCHQYFFITIKPELFQLNITLLRLLTNLTYHILT